MKLTPLIIALLIIALAFLIIALGAGPVTWTLIYRAFTGIVFLLSLVLWDFLRCQHDQAVKKWGNMPYVGGAKPSDAAIIREMIKHENELTNHRLGWLLTVEGLLFAALSFAWDKPEKEGLIVILSNLGIVVAGSAQVVLHAANMAFLELDGWWKAHRPRRYIGPDVCGFRFRPHEAFWGHITPLRMVPLLFIVSWFSIFWLKLTAC